MARGEDEIIDGSGSESPTTSRVDLSCGGYEHGAVCLLVLP